MIEHIKNKDNLKLIQTKDREELFDFIVDRWKKKGTSLIGFVYFAIFVSLKKDKNFRKDIEMYDFLLPDGIGLTLYFKKVFNKELENLNGSDLMPLYLDYLKKKNMEFAFYGTTQVNIEACAAKHSPYYFQNGFENLDWSKIKDNSSLFIGLGTPGQENFIKENMDKIESKNLQVLSIGGFFDFCSGNVKRAPGWIRKIKLEFLFRLMLDPKKHIKKNLLNLYLIYYIIKDKRS